MNAVKTGSYVGTGAAVTVELGFTPDYIRVWNETDGDEAYEWFKGMTNGHALKSANNASTQFSKITSNGISGYAGTVADKSAGITFGSALSESGKTWRYAAFRELD